MPPRRSLEGKEPVTRSRIVHDLRALGVTERSVLMAHTRMSALGWVVGGTQTVVEALLEAIGKQGTLMAYAGWEDHSYHLAKWPERWQHAYLAELPPFDSLRSAADPDHGVVPERIRTWPGAEVSDAHVGRMAAIGPQAAWLTTKAPSDHVFGSGSPLAKLVEADGRVLMLGAPLKTLTILHHAEALVDSPQKRMVSFQYPRRNPDDEVVWKLSHDHELSAGVAAFDQIARDALLAGIGRAGTVGQAEAHLFPAKELVIFAVARLTERFSGNVAPVDPASGAE